MPVQFQPPNPNGAYPNRHTLYLGVSGSGKSQALLQNAEVPRKGVRLIMFDHAPDHPGDHFRTRKGFLQALKRGLERNLKTGAGFRVAYSGPRSIEDYEWFCDVVWRCLDGRFITYLIVEELSKVCTGPGKATPNAALLLNEGRKYGLRFHGTTQKPQEISKTYFDQCEHKFVGQQKTRAQRRKMGEEIDVTDDQIRALNPLEFFRDDGTASEPELIKLPYRKPTGIRWSD